MSLIILLHHVVFGFTNIQDTQKDECLSYRRLNLDTYFIFIFLQK